MTRSNFYFGIVRACIESLHHLSNFATEKVEHITELSKSMLLVRLPRILQQFRSAGAGSDQPDQQQQQHTTAMRLCLHLLARFFQQQQQQSEPPVLMPSLLVSLLTSFVQHELVDSELRARIQQHHQRTERPADVAASSLMQTQTSRSTGNIADSGVKAMTVLKSVARQLNTLVQSHQSSAAQPRNTTNSQLEEFQFFAYADQVDGRDAWISSLANRCCFVYVAHDQDGNVVKTHFESFSETCKPSDDLRTQIEHDLDQTFRCVCFVMHSVQQQART